MINYKIPGIWTIIFTVLFMFSCSNDKAKEEIKEEEKQADTNQVINNNIVNVSGELFSIPSPMQTAMLVQKVGGEYDKEILNKTSNTNNYKTEFYKALNVGIYGADLGYATLYNHSEDALSFLAQIKKLSDELGIEDAFDANSLEKIKSNLGEKDSLMVLVGIAYRTGDAFLKNNKRANISALILAGGWIESLYCALEINSTKKNAEITTRVASQRQALASLIELLSRYETHHEYVPIMAAMRDLKKEYENVKFVYRFAEPTTDEKNKVTTINSSTDVQVSAEALQAIHKKVKTLRNLIVAPTHS